MPVLITATARSQLFGTVRRYLRPTAQRAARLDAARKLIETYRLAVLAIAADPQDWLAYPRPYPGLAAFGFQWIKIHRYWIGYVPGTDPIITNILDEVADVMRHASDDRDPADTA